MNTPDLALDTIDENQLVKAKAAKANNTSNLDTLTAEERDKLNAVTAPISAKKLQARILKSLQRSIKRMQESGGRPRIKAPKYKGPPVRVGFDAEWVTWPANEGGWWNEVLSIQAVIECGGKQAHYMFEPAGPGREDRPTMAQFIQQALRKAMKEGVIPSMPDKIVVFGHFIRGDLATFRDFWAHKREFRGLGKTLVSAQDQVLQLDEADSNDAAGDDPDRGWSGQSEHLYLRNLAGRQFDVRVRFIDTIKLTPGQKGLAYVGKMMGLPKLELHDGDKPDREYLRIPQIATIERPECVGFGVPAVYGKERMDLIKRDYRAEFDKYAYRDAEIALKYGLYMERFAGDQLGLGRQKSGHSRLPTTIAACATGLITRLADGSAALAELVGRTTVSRTFFDEATRRYRTVKRPEVSPGLAIYYQIARMAYHGGRNECFYHGPSNVTRWFDFDLPGAYTTALAALRPIDYDNIRQEFDPDAFGIDDMGVAWISFEFPEGTRFPCVPVRGAADELFFPLRGDRDDKVFVASPEIFLARQMGAKITIHQGIKAPWKSDERIFEPFTRLVQTKRREYPKDEYPALNELWKEVGNSGYGLTAQGLREKRVFDPKTMHGQLMGPSPLTEPFLAAWVTSFIRAVLGEILAGVPADGTVISATTDGLLTDVPIERLKLDGPICSYFADIRENLFGAREVLDPKPKHGARQIVSVAVRTTFTARAMPGLAPVCAKGSVKPPSGEGRDNWFMLWRFMRHRYGDTVVHEQLISAREQLTREADLYSVRRVRRLNLSYDHKRRPVDGRMMPIGRRSERIAWDTVPWQSRTEAEFGRSRAEGWRKGRQTVIRTLADFRGWDEYLAASLAMEEACRSAGIRTIPIREDNAAGVLKRLFLQAGRSGEWGLVFPPRGLTAIAGMLTEAGFATGKEDVTYAGRRHARLLPHCVALTPETVELLQVILKRFPTFDWRQAFRPADHSKVETLLQKGGDR